MQSSPTTSSASTPPHPTAAPPLPPTSPKVDQVKEIGRVLDGIDELEADEVVDLEEIDELAGLRVVYEVVDEERGPDYDDDDEDSAQIGGKVKSNSDPFDSDNFDLDFDVFGKPKVRIVEPKFKMTLAELLDESKVVPIMVYGNLEVEITGIEHDSRVVSPGDLFICCVGRNTDGHLYLTEADKRGAVAIVASNEIDIEERLECKALVIVEDTNAALAASFFRYPTKSMSVVGITGTSGKTTAAYLIKGMYEAMGFGTGLLSSVGNYVHGDNKLESASSRGDAVSVQKWMAKMLHNLT